MEAILEGKAVEPGASVYVRTKRLKAVARGNPRIGQDLCVVPAEVLSITFERVENGKLSWSGTLFADIPVDGAAKHDKTIRRILAFTPDEISWTQEALEK